MGLTALTLVGVLSLGAGPADPAPLNTRDLQIPIALNPARQQEVTRLLLFVSEDEGKSWVYHSAATPEKEAFTFSASRDGVYWFSVCTVDAKGNRLPVDMNSKPPDQRVLIDTLKPSVVIKNVERVGEEIQASWEIQELHPNLESLKLEYQAADAGENAPWTAVQLGPPGPALNGQARFRAPGPGPLRLRLQMLDVARNVGSDQKDVPAAATATGTPGSGAVAAGSRPGETAPIIPVRVSEPVGVPARPSLTGPSLPPTGAPIGVPLSPGASVAPAVSPPAFPAAPAAAPADPIGHQSSQGLSPNLPHGPLPPVQVVNSEQVTLAYEVTSQGPSGLRSVELWLTPDDGRTWSKCLEDSRCQSPLTVKLPGEGLFGLKLVLYSAAGLSQGPPVSGDLPEMRIEVDKTPPVVQLTAVEPVPDRGDVLMIRWTATDRNLIANPITLEYARQADGPWFPIPPPSQLSLPNTGSYAWQLPREIPYRVYLRLTARDAAGNVGEYKPLSSITVDLKKPVGVLKGIVATPTGLRP